MERLYSFIEEQIPKSKGLELEIRIGKHERGRFVPGITVDQFNTLLAKLDSPSKTIIEDNTFFKFPFRQRKNKTTGRVQWMKKNKVAQQDFEDLGLRVAMAEEETMSFPKLVEKFQVKNPPRFFAMEKIQLLRRKTRYSKTFGSWRIDLSQTESLNYKNRTWVSKGIDYELEIELTKQVDALTSLKQNKDLFFAFVEESPLSDYIQVTKSSSFVGNQPKTLERKDFNKLLTEPYSVTDKADGERALLLFTQEGSFLISKKMTKVPFVKETKQNGTLLDGELLNGRFLAFDLLFHKGQDMRNKTLSKRHQALDQVNKEVKSRKLTVKKFYYDTDLDISFVRSVKGNLLKTSKKLWDQRDRLYKYDLDGLIFTPVNQEYTMKTDILKWKDIVTLDVQVREKNGRWQFYVRDRSRIVDLRRQDAPLDKVAEDNQLITENSIVEYRKDKDEWIAHRVRTDKETPNALLTALSALKAIEQNITIEELSNISTDDAGIKYAFSGKDKKVRGKEPDVAYRNFHNKIKQDVLLEDKQSKNPKYLLDLACGKGADMIKWKKAGYTHILAIDSSWEHIYGKNGFVERYNKIKDTSLKDMEITIVWGDVAKGIRRGTSGLKDEEKDKIKEFFAKHGSIKFDTITCHFAIHYLLQTNKMFEGFIKNVKTLLAKDGKFIATYLDATKLKKTKQFKVRDTIIYEYEKMGDKIKIQTYQWDNPIEEPTVTPAKLKSKAKEYDLTVESDRSFEDFEGHASLSPDEKELSFLHRVIILTK